MTPRARLTIADRRVAKDARKVAGMAVAMHVRMRVETIAAKPVVKIAGMPGETQGAMTGGMRAVTLVVINVGMLAETDVGTHGRISAGIVANRRGANKDGIAGKQIVVRPAGISVPSSAARRDGQLGVGSVRVSARDVGRPIARRSGGRSSRLRCMVALSAITTIITAKASTSINSVLMPRLTVVPTS